MLLIRLTWFLSEKVDHDNHIRDGKSAARSVPGFLCRCRMPGNVVASSSSCARSSRLYRFPPFHWPYGRPATPFWASCLSTASAVIGDGRTLKGIPPKKLQRISTETKTGKSAITRMQAGPQKAELAIGLMVVNEMPIWFMLLKCVLEIEPLMRSSLEACARSSA